jgi:uncharacterized membrane protein
MSLADEIIQIFGFIGKLVCHQKQERTLFIGGHFLPVCARDTGGLIGLLLGYILLLFLRRKRAKGPPNLYVLLAMMLPLLLDSFGQLFGLWESTNDVRLATGLLFGTALSPLLVYALTLSPLKGKIPLLKNLEPEAAVLDDQDSWFDAKALGIGIVLSGFLFFAIRSLVGSEFDLFYWMLSVPMIVEIIWHFLILPPLLLIAAIGRYVRRK